MNPNYMSGWADGWNDRYGWMGCGSGWRLHREPAWRGESTKEAAERMRKEFKAFLQRVVEGIRRTFIKSTGWVTTTLPVPVTWRRPVWRVIAPGVKLATKALMSEGRPMVRDFIGPRIKRKEPGRWWG